MVCQENKSIRRLSLVGLFCFVALMAVGQGSYIPLGYDDYHIIDRYDIKYGKELGHIHTSSKPYSRPAIVNYVEQVNDSADLQGNKVWRYQYNHFMRDNSDWVDSIHMSKKPIIKKLYTEPAFFYSLNTKDFKLRINPVLHFELGAESEVSELKFMNTRGAEVRGNVKDRIGFYFYLGENQFRGNSYVQDWIIQNQAVPGEGFFKEFRTTGVDYFTARGYIDFNFLKYFTIQFGHNKNFIGNGYRSLFLSDFGNNYFFLKLQTRVWKINYQSIFTELTQQYERGADRLLDKKYAAFHHLNFSITKNFDLGLFEGVIFNRDNHFELQYLNPIIFYRSIEQELGSPDNAFIGIDFKVNFLRRFSVYGQMLFDEFNFSNIIKANGWWANKFGVQLGAKYIDVFGIKNLDGQVEFNLVRPYTYSHNTTANYSHYNQPLAHPLGANFRELMIYGRYQPLPQLVIGARYFNIRQGLDTMGSHWGSDITLPTFSPTSQGSLLVREFDNEIGQGVTTKTNIIQLLASYEIRHNIFFDLQVLYRNSHNDLESHNTINVNLGARMNIPYRSYGF